MPEDAHETVTVVRPAVNYPDHAAKVKVEEYWAHNAHDHDPAHRRYEVTVALNGFRTAEKALAAGHDIARLATGELGLRPEFKGGDTLLVRTVEPAPEE